MPPPLFSHRFSFEDTATEGCVFDDFHCRAGFLSRHAMAFRVSLMPLPHALLPMMSRQLIFAITPSYDNEIAAEFHFSFRFQLTIASFADDSAIFTLRHADVTRYFTPQQMASFSFQLFHILSKISSDCH
jgi:hypothetical protein